MGSEGRVKPMFTIIYNGTLPISVELPLKQCSAPCDQEESKRTSNSVRFLISTNLTLDGTHLLP